MNTEFPNLTIIKTIEIIHKNNKQQLIFNFVSIVIKQSYFIFVFGSDQTMYVKCSIQKSAYDYYLEKINEITHYVHSPNGPLLLYAEHEYILMLNIITEHIYTYMTSFNCKHNLFSNMYENRHTYFPESTYQTPVLK